MSTRTRIAVCAIGCLAFVVIACAISLRRPELPDFLRDPAKNAAYAELLKATSLAVHDRGTNYVKIVAENEKAFVEVARAMKAEVEAPESNYQSATMNPMGFVSAKDFSLALQAKGRVAESEGRPSEAAQAYLEAMRLGQKIEHGPLINFLVGATIERGGLQRMEGLMPMLSTNELRSWARELQSLNESRIAMDEIMRREHYFMARNATNIVDALRVRLSGKTRGLVGDSVESYRNLQAQVEVLAATMATVAYLRENGRNAEDTETLGRQYLKRAPIDPYAEDGLRTVVSTNGPVFYSIGKNGVDEKGKGDDIALKYDDQTAYRVMFRALSE